MATLVERVARAIGRMMGRSSLPAALNESSLEANWPVYVPQARAALAEVAAWLREDGQYVPWPDQATAHSMTADTITRELTQPSAIKPEGGARN